jgi:hypothetical protein
MVLAAQSGEREGESVIIGVGVERRHDSGTVPKPSMFGSAFDGDAGRAVNEGREIT